MYALVWYISDTVYRIVFVPWLRVCSNCLRACNRWVSLSRPPAFVFPRGASSTIQSTAAATTNYEVATPMPGATITVERNRPWMPWNTSNPRQLIGLRQLLLLRWWAARIQEAGRVCSNSVSYRFFFLRLRTCVSADSPWIWHSMYALKVVGAARIGGERFNGGLPGKHMSPLGEQCAHKIRTIFLFCWFCVRFLRAEM